MAGGVSYRCPTLSVGGTQLYDLERYSAELSADMIYQRADCRKYPQQAASTNHMAVISVTTTDLSDAAQASASSPLVGSSAGSVVLTVSNTSSGTMVYTQNPSVYSAVSIEGEPQSDIARLQMSFEAAGTAGTEPTVTWATGI